MAYNKRLNKNGFTIVELMIAVTVFSTAAVLITTGVIVIARQYQQASTRVALQEASRNIHQQVGESIKFSKGDIEYKGVAATSGYGYTCMGNDIYVHGIFNSPYTTTEYTATQTGLYLVQNVTCEQTSANINNGTNLLPRDARALVFSVSADGRISTTFTTSASDLLNLGDINNIQCKMGVAGREFCASVSLTSFSTQRVGGD